MSDVPVWLIFLIIWIGIGFLTALWMARRGHRDPRWLFMAVIFGPVLAVAAGERIQRHPQLLKRTESGHREHGTIRMLVGVDGSVESQAALEHAVHLLGHRVNALVVAEVVDYDAAETDRRRRLAEAQQRLTAVAARVGELAVTTEVLAGPPAPTLMQLALDQNIDIVVVGRHGRGLSKLLMGNVAQELVGKATVPVLVIGPGPGTSGP